MNKPPSTPEQPNYGESSKKPDVDSVGYIAGETADAVANLDYAELHKELRVVAYEQPKEITWNTRWQKVLDRTADLQMPGGIEDATEEQCRLMLMRGYAALVCPVDTETRTAIIAHLEDLTSSPIPYVASAAHHIVGKIIVLGADLPNMTMRDPVEIEVNIAKRLSGINHYRAVQITDVRGDSIQLSGRADLPDATLDTAYADHVSPGAELPVKRIVPPKRLIGTGLEGVAVLQMFIGQQRGAAQSVQAALDELSAHLSMYGEQDTPFNVMNIRLAEFASTGLAVNLQSSGYWSNRDSGILHSAESMKSLADQLLTEVEALGLDDWKKAEWQACIQAGIAMSAEFDHMRNNAVETMLERLTTYITTRPEGKGGRAAAKKVLGHDAIYALVMKKFGTPEQQQAFAELLA